ncbi:unnamed protein product (macronuclear) [Paramecium tetraurelia]|uniref:Transmembrane protein n=1 Tax=Paramecium tetraurelia TaxID=5888 RepID=A0E8H2_PARTE|nr:uncharacterized protein GSPATT00024318001 [Paramecium tetraurelia]CAK91589.1 unnamed protein product [Paramecium tetraurelia]|eukprot:XP_001458986.1 hypothetical protein (macronuclear) [Paramecium tetraurelia strain d4-2]
MDFNEIQTKVTVALQQFTEYTQNHLHEYGYSIYILVGIISLIVGFKIGKSDILVSKKQIKQLEQFKYLKEQKEKSKEQLLNEFQKLTKFSKIFYFLILIGNSCIYYFKIEVGSIEIQIAFSLALIILIEGYKVYEKYRLSSIKHNLEQTEKETNQIIHEIQKNLGEEIRTILKKEALLEQRDFIKKQLQASEALLKQQYEDKYKGQIEELRKKILTLENKEQQQKEEIQNFKRTTQIHKTEPLIRISQKKIEDGTTNLRKEIAHLEKEGKIQKDMISKVINFEWCGDCVSKEVHCIKNYFQYASKIGVEYQQQLDQLKQEEQVQN